jgi:hypothetical protein
LPFLPTSTVYSARHRAGLLHPATGRGVRCVWARSWSWSEDRDRGLAFPDSATPFKAFPFAAAVSVSPRAVALSPLLLASASRPSPLLHRSGAAGTFEASVPFARPQGFAPLQSPLRVFSVAAE